MIHELMKPVIAFGGILLVFFTFGQYKKKEGKQELKAQQDKDRLDVIEETAQRKNDIAGMHRDDVIAELHRKKH